MLVSSLIRVPAANSIKLVQSGIQKSVIAAAKSLSASKGGAGVFRGFIPSILEEFCEMEINDKSYKAMRRYNNGKEYPLVYGALSGTMASLVTTPIDVVKTHMACHGKGVVGTVKGLVGAGGPHAMFRCLHMRAANSAIKAALFFWILHEVKNQNEAAHKTNI
jgi:hypothetical protein